MTRRRKAVGPKLLCLAAWLRSALAGAGAVALTTPLWGAVLVLAALALVPHGGRAL